MDDYVVLGFAIYCLIVFISIVRNRLWPAFITSLILLLWIILKKLGG